MDPTTILQLSTRQEGYSGAQPNSKPAMPGEVATKRYILVSDSPLIFPRHDVAYHINHDNNGPKSGCIASRAAQAPLREGPRFRPETNLPTSRPEQIHASRYVE
jgi:hypothetical protein